MTCCGNGGNTYEMTMARNSPEFEVSKKCILIPFKGTDLTVYSLLPGLRSLTGEKIQRYLASELRDRIRNSGVTIKVVDRTGRPIFKDEKETFRPARYCYFINAWRL